MIEHNEKQVCPDKEACANDEKSILRVESNSRLFSDSFQLNSQQNSLTNNLFFSISFEFSLQVRDILWWWLHSNPDRKH